MVRKSWEALARRIALYDERVLNLSDGEDGAEPVALAYAGPALFRVLGVKPALGRLFTEEDGRPGFMDGTWTIPVLLSHDLWQRRYGGDPGILGRVIAINDLPRKVIGVLPEGFAFPRRETQIWVLSMPEPAFARLGGLGDDAIARLRPGITPERAAAELARILPSIEGVYRDATAERLAALGLKPTVVPLKDEVVGNVSRALWPLLGGMGILLLVACANVANLFLVRANQRAHEVAVRAALGARRGDLARLFLGEGLLVAAAGAAAGFLFAGWGVDALVTFRPVDLPRLHEVRLDGQALAVTSGVAVLAALLFGVLSVLRRSAPALSPALKSDGRGGTESRERRRVRGALVAAQVALALTLLVGSALMVQSFIRLMRVDPGFDAEGVLTVDIALPYRDAADHQRIYDALVERMRALPGVEAAAAVNVLPLAADAEPTAYPIRVAGRPARPADVERTVALKFFTPGYFRTMRTPVVEGTGFASAARPTGPHPVLVSAALARRLFPGAATVGRRIRRLDISGDELPKQPDYTIAGVVADVRDASLRADPAEIVYVPILTARVEPHIVPTDMSLVIRADIPPLALAPTVRRAIRDFDLGLARIRTLDAIVSASAAQTRFLTVLLLIAGTTSLFLGAVGIYGVVAYAVRQRTQEIGVRIALGAGAARTTAMVLRESSSLVLLGAAIGLAAAFAATRTLRAILFGVSATDALTFGAATAFLVGVALVASLLPARRAARVDPMVALRAE